ncbi:hypothetical protein CPC08DRAFT_709948 [Agrocybe pediades]|nr:hypothetical protein CPC08DRAFT_709948 [Agrocybe pediades]
MALSFALHNDLLWRIFDIVASGEDDLFPDSHPLQTLFHVSHTCAVWRDIILSSPSLWAKCLNFDVIRTKELRTEVIRRTGNAPLYITRRQASGHSDVEMEFADFLKHNWHRIRSVVSAISVAIEEKILEILSLPAPILVYFGFRKASDEGDKPLVTFQAQTRENIVIFGGGAPCLQELYLETYAFYPRSIMFCTQPFPQLRSLKIHAVFNAEELLETLRSTPLLESLDFQLSNPHFARERVVTDGIISPFSSTKVALPCLKNLHVYTDHTLPDAITFLDRLDIETHFALSFQATANMIPREDVVRLARILSVLFRHSGGNISDEDIPFVVNVDTSYIYISSGLMGFNMRLSTARHSFIEGISSLLQPFINSPYFHAAKSLILFGQHDSIRNLLASLTSVKILHVSYEDFAVISKWSGELHGCGELLPALEELEFSVMNDGPALEVLLLQFADNRIARYGLPLRATYCTEGSMVWEYDPMSPYTTDGGDLI